jgi:osmotically inducible protein OsmC
MPVRKANAVWEGDLKSGNGNMQLAGGAYNGAYSFASRFEEGTGTNPEELIAAAHSGCFSMFLANVLAQAGHTPRSVRTTANVHLGRNDTGPAVTRIELQSVADVPGLDDAAFQQHAENAKQNCPISKLLKNGAEIVLDARLAG